MHQYDYQNTTNTKTCCDSVGGKLKRWLSTLHGTFYRVYETKIFIALCERTFKSVIQVLLYFCARTFC